MTKRYLFYLFVGYDLLGSMRLNRRLTGRNRLLNFERNISCTFRKYVSV